MQAVRLALDKTAFFDLTLQEDYCFYIIFIYFLLIINVETNNSRSSFLYSFYDEQKLFLHLSLNFSTIIWFLLISYEKYVTMY